LANSLMIMQRHKLSPVHAIGAINGMVSETLQIYDGLTKTVINRKIFILLVNQGLDAIEVLH